MRKTLSVECKKIYLDYFKETFPYLIEKIRIDLTINNPLRSRGKLSIILRFY